MAKSKAHSKTGLSHDEEDRLKELLVVRNSESGRLELFIDSGKTVEPVLLRLDDSHIKSSQDRYIPKLRLTTEKKIQKPDCESKRLYDTSSTSTCA